MRYTIIALAFMSGCGRAGDLPDMPYYDPDIKIAVEAFIVDFPARYVPWYPTVTWNYAMPDGIAGLCWNAIQSDAYIELDARYRGMPEYTKWLVYHEMGHCVLGLDHDKANRSIMGPMMVLLPEYDWDIQLAHMKTLKRGIYD